LPLAEALDFLYRANLYPTEGDTEPLASGASTFGSEQCRQTRPDEKSGQADELFVPPSLPFPAADFPLQLRDGVGSLAPKTPQPPANPLPSASSLLGSEQDGRAGAEGGREHEEGAESAPLTLSGSIGRFELEMSMIVCHAILLSPASPNPDSQSRGR
jgi:hypothetical protein